MAVHVLCLVLYLILIHVNGADLHYLTQHIDVVLLLERSHPLTNTIQPFLEICATMQHLMARCPRPRPPIRNCEARD